MEKTKIIPTSDQYGHLKNLWDNVDGEIIIIYPALDTTRWANELQMLFNDHLINSPLISDELRSKKGTEELSIWISRFGPHLTSGDMYACMHIIMLLSIFYGADTIKFAEAFHLKTQNPDILSNILSNNLVLIGGPSGNPITNEILKRLNLNSIFPDAPKNDFTISMPDGHIFRPFPNPNEPLSYKTGNKFEDIGIFLKCKNPLNPKKIIYAVMGSNSWGTQGAASLCCSADGANVIHSSYEYAKAVFNSEIYLSCIKVFKNNDLKVGDIEENRRLQFQSVWPMPEKEIHKNPTIVCKTIADQVSDLKNSALSEIHILLSFGWGRAVLTIFLFMAFSFVLALSFAHKIELRIAIPLLLCSLYLGIYYFFRLPTKRNIKDDLDNKNIRES